MDDSQAMKVLQTFQDGLHHKGSFCFVESLGHRALQGGLTHFHEEDRDLLESSGFKGLWRWNKPGFIYSKRSTFFRRLAFTLLLSLQTDLRSVVVLGFFGTWLSYFPLAKDLTWENCIKVTIQKNCFKNSFGSDSDERFTSGILAPAMSTQLTCT